MLCLLGVQVVELPNHPYFVGVQFHPEFKSRPGKPSAVFLGKFVVITIILWIAFFIIMARICVVAY